MSTNVILALLKLNAAVPHPEVIAVFSCASEDLHPVVHIALRVEVFQAIFHQSETSRSFMGGSDQRPSSGR
jgi:hypothetical protein